MKMAQPCSAIAATSPNPPPISRSAPRIARYHRAACNARRHDPEPAHTMSGTIDSSAAQTASVMRKARK